MFGFSRLEVQRTSGAVSSDEVLGEMVVRHGLPLLVLDPQRAVSNFAAVRDAIPLARLNHRVSTLSHPAVLAALAIAGAGFEVTCAADIAALKTAGVNPASATYSAPITNSREAFAAYCDGVRIFVVDHVSELDKFVGYHSSIELVVRLRVSGSSPEDASRSARGLALEDAKRLVRTAHAQGIHISGFGFHLGSATRGPQPYIAAVARTLGLMVELENELDCRFDVLDLGGDLPVSNADGSGALSELGEALRAVLDPLAGRLSFLAEPGDALTAGCLTLLTDSMRAPIPAALMAESTQSGLPLAVLPTTAIQEPNLRGTQDARRRLPRAARRDLDSRAATG